MNSNIKTLKDFNLPILGKKSKDIINYIKVEKPPHEPKKVHQIKKISDKRAKENQDYTKKKKAYLAAYPNCQAKLKGCQVKAKDIHHTMSGADRQKYFLVMATWMGVCRKCHTWIETHPKESKERGFIK